METSLGQSFPQGKLLGDGGVLEHGLEVCSEGRALELPPETGGSLNCRGFALLGGGCKSGAIKDFSGGGERLKLPSQGPFLLLGPPLFI